MRLPIALLCFALAGCFGLDLVGPAANGPTRADVWVYVQQTDSVEVMVAAVFQLGADSAGRLVSLSDTAIVVDGRRIVRDAQPTSPPDHWLFSWRSGPADPATIERIAVHIPALAHSPGTGVTLEIPRFARLGAHVVSLPAAGDLRLPISAPEVPLGPDAATASWQLMIGDACIGATSQHRVMSGTGWFPDEVRIPRSIIDARAATDFAVCFTAGMSYRSPDAPYEIQVVTTSQVEWLVRR